LREEAPVQLVGRLGPFVSATQRGTSRLGDAETAVL